MYTYHISWRVSHSYWYIAAPSNQSVAEVSVVRNTRAIIYSVRGIILTLLLFTAVGMIRMLWCDLIWYDMTMIFKVPGTRCVRVFFINRSFCYTRRHPAHPVSALIVHPREIQGSHTLENNIDTWFQICTKYWERNVSVSSVEVRLLYLYDR